MFLVALSIDTLFYYKTGKDSLYFVDFFKCVDKKWGIIAKNQHFIKFSENFSTHNLTVLTNSAITQIDGGHKR